MQTEKTQLYLIKEYLEIFYRRKWYFILTFFPIVAVGNLVSSTIPHMYKSTTTILVERQQVPERYVSSTVRTDIGTRLNTIRQQVMSRTRLEKIIDDYGVQFVPNWRTEMIAKILSRFGIENQKTVRSKQDIVRQMRQSIILNITGKDAFQVSYIGAEPELTMNITNALASMFIEANLKLREQRVEGTSEFLAIELEGARQEVEEMEATLSAFNEKNMGSLPDQLDANLRTLDRLQLELQGLNNAVKDAEGRRMFFEEMLNSLDGLMGVSNAQLNIKSPQEYNPIGKELIDLKNKLSSLRGIYKDSYPDVRIIKNRIDELERQLAKEIQTNENKNVEQSIVPIQDPEGQKLEAEFQLINMEIKSLNEKEAIVKKRIRELEHRVDETFKNDQKLKGLVRDYGLTQRNYQSLLQKKINARLSANMEKRQKGEQFYIIDPANLPEKPFGGDANKVRLIGWVAGAGLGVGLIALVEFLNPAFRKPEDFIGLTDIPVFATIPRFSIKALKK